MLYEIRQAFYGAILAGFLLSPAVGESLSVVYHFDPPSIDRINEYANVTIPGCEQLHRIGEPALPFRTAKVLLPPGRKITRIETQTPDAPKLMKGSWRIEYGRTPVRQPGLQTTGVNPTPDDQPDPAIYFSENPYPADRVQLISVQRQEGFDLALLRVFPIQYAPLYGQLFYARQITVTLHLAPDTLRGEARRRPDRMASFVDNPDVLSEYRTPPSRALTDAGTVYDYLLITRAALTNAFQPLMTRKTQDGLAVYVETVESITNGYPGRDIAEKIRSCIRNAYTNWGVSYVLLGGDTATVPCRYAYVDMNQPEIDSIIPCDLYYACLDGSWNRDNDNRWGESTDGEDGGDVDLLAEVYVGRAPVDTAGEVANFVEKNMRYEEQGNPRAGSVLLTAGYLGYYSPDIHAQGGDMFDPLLPSLTPYSLTWLDDRPDITPQWTAADAIAALNRSPHVALYNGHGDVDSMMRLFTADVDAITNQNLFFCYTVGCNAGQFDNDNFSPDSIGEDFIKRHTNGAFAAVLNSRFGWFDPQQEWKYSGEFQLRFFNELLSLGRTNIGMANQLSKHDMVGQVESTGIMPYRWCYYEINLLGDPHTPFRLPEGTRWLTVDSVRGGAFPTVGRRGYPSGSVVTCSVTNSPVSGGSGTQHVCAGWSGDGSVPVSGTSTQVLVTLTNDSHLVWNWTTQLFLSATAGNHGRISGGNAWYDAGKTDVVVQASASNYYHFTLWEGDTPTDPASNAILTVTMDRPRSLTAGFAENLTAQGTPEWWLASYGWTNEFEAAAQSDTDEDRLAAWEEWIAGTHPADSGSVFKAGLAVTHPGSPYVVRWSSASNRFYAVDRASRLDGSFERLTNNMPATPPFNTYTDSYDGLAVRFYRVEVSDRM